MRIWSERGYLPLKTFFPHLASEETAFIASPESAYFGQNVYVGAHTILEAQGGLSIGNHVWIGAFCFFQAYGKISIGNQVGIGPRVSILTSQHRGEGCILNSPLEAGPITLEDDCDIGLGSILLPGVTIGKGALIGAGSVVTRSIPPYTIAYGNPATVRKDR